MLMNKKILYSLIGVLIGLVFSLSVYANFLSDWTNEDLCRWTDVNYIPENISDEIYERKLICDDDFEVSELTANRTYTNENGTVFPSPKLPIVPKVKTESGFTFIVNYKITL